MSFKMAVWYSDEAMSEKQASILFRKLYNRETELDGQHPQVYSFYYELGTKFPELETMSEEEREDSPWACSHDRTGSHVMMELFKNPPGAEVEMIRELAEKYGLTYYEPQTPVLQLPLALRPEAIQFAKAAAGTFHGLAPA